MNIFYARVSSSTQNIERQLEQAHELGIDERYIFADVASGKNFDRPQYQALKVFLRPGDTLYISSLDRLGRNWSETAQEWRYLTEEAGVGIRVLDQPLLNIEPSEGSQDTPDSPESFARRVVREITLQMLLYFAKYERDMMLERQRQGIAAAKLRGAYTGRKRLDVDKNLFARLYAQTAAGERTAVSAQKRLKVCRSTWYNLVREYETKTGRFADE